MNLDISSNVSHSQSDFGFTSPSCKSAHFEHSITEDSSNDLEWELFQEKLRIQDEEIEECNVIAADIMKLDQTVDIIEEIAEKEEIVATKKELAFELQKRFIWDLSFALKQYYLFDTDTSPEDLKKYSSLELLDIVKRSVVEKPEPHEWISWVVEQYQKSI